MSSPVAIFAAPAAFTVQGRDPDNRGAAVTVTIVPQRDRLRLILAGGAAPSRAVECSIPAFSEAYCRAMAVAQDQSEPPAAEPEPAAAELEPPAAELEPPAAELEPPAAELEPAAG